MSHGVKCKEVVLSDLKGVSEILQSCLHEEGGREGEREGEGDKGGWFVGDKKDNEMKIKGRRSQKLKEKLILIVIMNTIHNRLIGYVLIIEPPPPPPLPPPGRMKSPASSGGRRGCGQRR